MRHVCLGVDLLQGSTEWHVLAHRREVQSSIIGGMSTRQDSAVALQKFMECGPRTTSFSFILWTIAMFSRLDSVEVFVQLVWA